MLEVDRRRGAELQGCAFEPVSGWLARREAGVRHAVLTGGDPFATARAGGAICHVDTESGDGASGVHGDDEPALTLLEPTSLGGIANALAHFVLEAPDAHRRPVVLQLRSGQAYPALLATLRAAALTTVRDGDQRVPWAAPITIQDHKRNDLVRYEPGNGHWPHRFVYSVSGPQQAAQHLREVVNTVRAQWHETLREDDIVLQLECPLAALNDHARKKLGEACAAGLAALRDAGFRNVVVRAGTDAVAELCEGDLVSRNAGAAVERAVVNRLCFDSPSPQPSPQTREGVRTLDPEYIAPPPIRGISGTHLIPTMPPGPLETVAAFALVPYRQTNIPVPMGWDWLSRSVSVTRIVLRGDADELVARVAAVPPDQVAALKFDATVPEATLSPRETLRVLSAVSSRAAFAICPNGGVISVCARLTHADGTSRAYEYGVATDYFGWLAVILCEIAQQEPERARPLQSVPTVITVESYAPVLTRRCQEWLDDVVRLLRDHGYAQVVVRDRSGHVLAASDLVGETAPVLAWMALPVPPAGAAVVPLTQETSADSLDAHWGRPEVVVYDEPGTMPPAYPTVLAFLRACVTPAAVPHADRYLRWQGRTVAHAHVDPVAGGVRGVRIASDIFPSDEGLVACLEWLAGFAERAFPVEVLVRTPVLPVRLTNRLSDLQQRHGVGQQPRVAVVTPLEQWAIGDAGRRAQWAMDLRTVAAALQLPIVGAEVEHGVAMQSGMAWSTAGAAPRVTVVPLPQARDPCVRRTLGQIRLAKFNVTTERLLSRLAAFVELGWITSMLESMDATIWMDKYRTEFMTGRRGSGRPPLHCLASFLTLELLLPRLALFERVWQHARAADKDVARFDRRFALRSSEDTDLPPDAVAEILRVFCTTMALAHVSAPDEALIRAAYTAAQAQPPLSYDVPGNDPACPVLAPAHPWGAAVHAIRAALIAQRRAPFPLAHVEELDGAGFVEAVPALVPTAIPAPATPFVDASLRGLGRGLIVPNSDPDPLATVRRLLAREAMTDTDHVSILAEQANLVGVVRLLSGPTIAGTVDVALSQTVALRRVPLLGGAAFDCRQPLTEVDNVLRAIVACGQGPDGAQIRALPICLTLDHLPPLITRAAQTFLEDALERLRRDGFARIVVRDALGTVYAATDTLPPDVATRIDAPLLELPDGAEAVDVEDVTAWRDAFAALGGADLFHAPLRADRYLHIHGRAAVHFVGDPDFGVVRGIVIDAGATPLAWVIELLQGLADTAPNRWDVVRNCPIEIYWHDLELPAAVRALVPALDAAGVAERLHGVRFVTPFTTYFFGSLDVAAAYYETYLTAVWRQLGVACSAQERAWVEHRLLALWLGRQRALPIASPHSVTGIGAMMQLTTLMERVRQEYLARGATTPPLALLLVEAAQVTACHRSAEALRQARDAVRFIAGFTPWWESVSPEWLCLPGPTLLLNWTDLTPAAGSQRFVALLTQPSPADPHPPLYLLSQVGNLRAYRFRPALFAQVWQALLASARDKRRYVAQFALRLEPDGTWPPYTGVAAMEMLRLCLVCQAFEFEGVHTPDAVKIARVLAAVTQVLDAVSDAAWEAARASATPLWTAAHPEWTALTAARAVVRGETPVSIVPPPAVAAPAVPARAVLPLAPDAVATRAVTAAELSGLLLLPDLGEDAELVRWLLEEEQDN